MVIRSIGGNTKKTEKKGLRDYNDITVSMIGDPERAGIYTPGKGIVITLRKRKVLTQEEIQQRLHEKYGL